MKNLLLVLQTAIAEQNYPEALSRLRLVVGELDTGALKHYTGLTVIDAMLSYKQERALAAGASFAVHAPALDIPAGAAYDIAAMLAIMLDNAADAADAAAGGTDRFTIRCDIQQKGRIVFITFTNPLAAPLRRHKGEIVSAKPESGHGLGLPSLRRLAEKYGGNVQIEDADGVFSISVLLSVP
jgi:sensor histidine kinase regulating citrate/malate metabolism